MATVSIRVDVTSVKELRELVESLIDEIEKGRVGEGCSDYDFNVDGTLEGVDEVDEEILTTGDQTSLREFVDHLLWQDGTQVTRFTREAYVVEWSSQASTEKGEGRNSFTVTREGKPLGVETMGDRIDLEAFGRIETLIFPQKKQGDICWGVVS